MERSCSCFMQFFILLSTILSIVCTPSGHPYVDLVDRNDPWSTIELTFDLDPGQEECFYQRVVSGFRFQLTYQAVSKEVQPNLRVIVRSERGERLYASFIKLEDDFVKEVFNDGIYIMCFGNHGSRIHKKRVFMSITILNELRLQDFFRLKEETSAHLVNASAHLKRTWSHIRQIMRDQYRLRHATQLDEYMMANNADYILYWSIAQAVIIITAGMAQVWTLRSFFNAKTLTPSQKPRC